MEEAKVTFYRFDKCGLFEYGAEESKRKRAIKPTYQY